MTPLSADRKQEIEVFPTRPASSSGHTPVPPCAHTFFQCSVLCGAWSPVFGASLCPAQSGHRGLFRAPHPFLPGLPDPLHRLSFFLFPEPFHIQFFPLIPNIGPILHLGKLSLSSAWP